MRPLARASAPTHRPSSAARSGIPVVSAVLASALLLTACAGSAGGGGGGGAAGEGFAHGAPQEEVDALLADLDPVTLTYQPAAAGPNSIMAPEARAFAEEIEERSGGRITLDIVWGQAIAGYTEIPNALADGRLDISYALPIYMPAEFPSYDAAATALNGVRNSPFLGEIVYNAVSADIGWQNTGLLEEYAAEGASALNPMISSGGYYMVCRDPGSAPEDWAGRQVRIASTAHHAVVEALGASPVSMEYVEVYEALQRGTVDCSLAELLPTAESSLPEVAPYITYVDDATSFSSRAVGAMLAGPSFDALPLPYRQIVFDAGQTQLAGMTGIVMDGTAASMAGAKEHGGAVEAMDPASAEIIRTTNAELTAGVVSDGLLGDDVEARIDESEEHWATSAEALGLTDTGAPEDFDTWYDPGAVDLDPFAAEVFEHAFLAHRPE
ncbi:TRAP transporter substrate-binding protein DctP [Brevibacterium samyangense]|uniref:TRAP-type C4-dicarboxylate transport system, substrate-binding protein n=1 Tax=Brevibacterium samyangense TaxID=366888 RepID=A0ABN2THR5_9MICO